MQFTISHQDKDTSARQGTLTTNHSDIQTPVFMPIGTQGAVKTIDPEVLTHLDAQIGWDPEMTPICWHGVTTALIGNCGLTFAPC